MEITRPDFSKGNSLLCNDGKRIFCLSLLVVLFGNIIFNEGLNTWVFCRRIRSLSLLHLDSVKTFGEIFCLIFNIASGGELKMIDISIFLYDKE